VSSQLFIGKEASSTQNFKAKIDKFPIKYTQILFIIKSP